MFNYHLPLVVMLLVWFCYRVVSSLLLCFQTKTAPSPFAELSVELSFWKFVRDAILLVLAFESSASAVLLVILIWSLLLDSEWINITKYLKAFGLLQDTQAKERVSRVKSQQTTLYQCWKVLSCVGVCVYIYVLWPILSSVGLRSILMAIFTYGLYAYAELVLVIPPLLVNYRSRSVCPGSIGGTLLESLKILRTGLLFTYLEMPGLCRFNIICQCLLMTIRLYQFSTLPVAQEIVISAEENELCGVAVSPRLRLSSSHTTTDKEKAEFAKKYPNFRPMTAIKKKLA